MVQIVLGQEKETGQQVQIQPQEQYTPDWTSPRQGPRIFGLTKMLGGYHYRQSRNDNPSPPRSHQPKGKPET